MTDLVDNLAQDKVSILWTIPFNGCHKQIAEAIDGVWQLIQQMETAWQHCVSEGMELSTVQGLSLQKTLQTASLFFLSLFSGSPFLLLTPSCCLLRTQAYRKELQHHGFCLVLAYMKGCVFVKTKNVFIINYKLMFKVKDADGGTRE